METTGAPTRLVLIRHGESRSTVDRVVGGHEGCTGLSERGVEQAEALRKRLDRTAELKDCSALLTSVLPRAIETASIIAPAIGGLVAAEHCDLCEIHPGDADGMTWAEFEERYRKVGFGSRSPYAMHAEGSESWAVFFARVGAAFGRVIADHLGQTVAIVVHGGVIEASLAVFGNMPLRRGFDVSIANTSLTEWVRPAEPHVGPEGERWKLVRFNDAAHLA